MNTSDIKNLKREDLRYISIPDKEIDAVYYHSVQHIANHPQRYLALDSGSLGLLSVQDLFLIDAGILKILFDYEIIGYNILGEAYILCKPSKIKKIKIYFKSWLLDINRKILFTLMIWEFIDNQLGAIPQWKDLKILKRK